MCEELHNQDDVCNFVVFQKWASPEKYEAYLNWRMESGMMEEMLMAEEPSIRFYDQAADGLTTRKCRLPVLLCGYGPHDSQPRGRQCLAGGPRASSPR